VRVKNAIINKSSTWTPAMRPRIGQSTKHGGYFWANVTGRNSEPGTSNDWVYSGPTDEPKAVEILLWNGYEWHKRANNLNEFPVAGELLEGRGDGRFKGGDYVKGEVTNDDPQDDNDFYCFVNYP